MKRILLLANPSAKRGASAKLLDAARREFVDAELEVVIPANYEAFCARLRQACETPPDQVVVMGGDGTINAAVNHLASSGIPLGIIPAGTANDLAKHLGIPEDVGAACRVIKQGRTQAVDLLQVNEKLFVTAGGLGVVSDVAIGVNALKQRDGIVRETTKLLGGLVYMIYSFGVLAFQRQIARPLQIRIDGHSLGERSAVAIFVHNQPSLGGGVQSFPGACSDDGRLGLCVMEERNRLQSILTVVLMKLGGAHRNRREIGLHEGEELEIVSPDPVVFIGDGEVLADDHRLLLKVIPRALQVIA